MIPPLPLRRPAALRRALRLAALICCLCALWLPRTAGAATVTPQAALDRLLTASHAQGAWFAPSFLSQVSVSQVDQAVSGVKATLGRYKGSKPLPDGMYLLSFERGTVVAQITLDQQGRIAGLFFRPPQLTAGLPAALQSVRALPGKVGVLALTDGAARVDVRANQPLAVGSAFKLAVLAALQRQIASGKHAWGEVVTLRAQDRSLPSGILQSWPDGSHLTLETLASLMISQSDNTAADALIRVLGRPAIDPLIPARDRPILSTHAFFVLRDPGQATLRKQYLTGNAAQRLAAVQQAEKQPLPLPSSFASGPQALEVEWLFSPRELCDLMQQVYRLPLMGINPGVAQPGDWRTVAFKDGSEPGVLALTTMVTSLKGKTSCLTATWNNAAGIDGARFTSIYQSLLGSLK